MTVAAELKDQLAALPDSDRAELASFLISSLDQGSDEDAADAWDVELRRRNQEIDEGRAKCIPADQMMAQLDEKYREVTRRS